MTQDLISVIVPTFNAERTLARCLDSIAAQTYQRIEVVVMDGGSSDRTLGIVAEHGKGLAGLRVVSERDAGIYDAMNKAVAICSGTWVYFMGSDDELYSADALQTMAAHFGRNVDFLYANVMRMTTRRVEGGRFDRDRLLTQNMCHQAILYRRDLLSRVGAFNLDYKVYADWDLNIRCFALPCRAQHVEATLCRYDCTGFSSSTTDHVFLDRKLPEIAKLYRCSFWSRVFRSCRYNFLDQAQSRRAQRRFAAAAYYYAIFFFHGALARLDAARARRRALPDSTLARKA